MKYNNDYIKGLNDRRMVADYINSFMATSAYRLDEMHPYQVLMDIKVKSTNNVLPNRIHRTFYKKAMGVDYFLTKQEVGQKIPIRFLFKGKSGIYFKVPSDFINQPEQYLMILSHLNYYILVVDKHEKKGKRKINISIPIHIDIFINNWKWKMGTNSNKTRLQFKGKVRSIETSHPLIKNVFDITKIDYLKELL
ncbi:MAG: hypothetical protein KGY70_18450 [Bacteroidales bacterium]|nr:hypothetical protein [Bacteroidales bacterium]